jgi:hypothetical protein
MLAPTIAGGRRRRSRIIVDGGDELGGVCGCAGLDCVAGYVDALMGCDVCMTFACGDDLVGACAACAP